MPYTTEGNKCVPYNVSDFANFHRSTDLLAVGNSYSTVQQELRVNHYLGNLNRYEGSNDLLELNLNNTYPDFRQLKNGIPLMATINLNLYQKITKKWVDLLFGEEPKITVDEQYQEQLDRIMLNSDLFKQAKKNQTCGSIYGNSVYKIVWNAEKGQAEIVNQLPNAWTPVCNPANPEEITEHIITWTYKVPKDKTFTDKVLDFAKNIMFFGQMNTDTYTIYLQAEIYTAGKVENKLYKLGTWANGFGGGTTYGIAQEIELEGIEPIVDTQIDDFLVYAIPNIEMPASCYGLDDYSNVQSIIDSMSMIVTKFAHDIKHQGNILETSITNKAMIDEGLMDLVNGVLFKTNADQPDSHKITWDVQSQAVLDCLNKLTELFYLQSDLNPALFGDIKQGFADSGIAIKRLMANTLQVASEKVQNQKKALEWAILTASKLEAANGVGVEIPNVTVEFQDGLINDLTETINQAIAMRDGGLMSREKAITMVQGLDDVGLAAEMALIKADFADDMGLPNETSQQQDNLIE